MNPSLDTTSLSLGVLPLVRRLLADETIYARLLGAFWVSVALHALLGSRIDALPPVKAAIKPPSEVRIQVVAAKPPPPVPAEPEPPPRVQPPKPRPKLAPEPAPVPEPPPAAEPAAPPPPELSGVTMTGDGAAAFTMPSGDGQSRSAPVGGIGSAPPVVQEAPPAPRGPRVVPLGELGARPVPPSLAQALSRNYPPEARRRGVAGKASVRARIDADGVPRALRVVEESFAGFGPACRDTLAASRWSAPRDRDGSAVSSEVLYTCRFVITP
jgi:periplasmic protein TonB